MNKKGANFLGEETLRILVAFICISFLVLFLVSLYSSKVGANKINEAESNLNQINEVISGLDEGETQNQNVPNPGGWHIYSFVNGEKPNACAGENCLCICSEAIIFKTQVEKCNKKGSCLIISNLVSSDLDINIKNGQLNILGIKKQNEQIFIGEVE